ncbi:hypothetical protein [Roseiconus lacunae]|uniref:Uncharacterized protein n=1 Tax=Roseiconus lacunae TaxID=2605694 RepID=A0ABT7PNR0_9BACT|nr:hypothetical protein [Roseiconus lacunae]MDM4018149.1 hypothetical protein [Roseiconus lacunae]
MIDEVQTTDSLDLSSLRHVLVSKDFAGDVRRWQRALNRPQAISENAIGKAFSWCSEGAGHSTSIVLMQSDFFQGVVHGISIARGILCHELAHVHEYAQRLPETNYEAPDARDLDAVLEFIAQSVASEYLAERVASRQYSTEDLADFVANADTIVALLNSFDQEKHAYRSHGDTLHIWQHSILAVSRAADMTGRTIGEYYRERRLFDEFIRRLKNPKWAGIAEQLSAALTRDTSKREVAGRVSGGTIREMFHAVGVYPRLQEGGLYIDIP